jgi:hypothetical protein
MTRSAEKVPAEMVFARLQLLAPSARSLVVAGARSSPDTRAFADRLARTIAEAGHKVRWLDVAGAAASVPVAGGIEQLPPPVAQMGDAQIARGVLDAGDGFTVICGGGVLDSAATLLLTSGADGVILVVRLGKTERSDLAEARAEIDRAGGHLLGAVLT